MLANQRIFHYDGGTLEDKSVDLNNIFSAGTVIDLQNADYLYIGSDLPFNHRYFNVSSANAVISTMSVEIWDGNAWVAAVDVIDQTSTGGKTLAQSGFISWTLPRNGSWGQEATTEDIAALSTLKIYDLYWVRLAVSINVSITTALSYIGFRFAGDDDLGGYYPSLIGSSVLDAYETGKTTWAEQHFLAAEDIINDIRAKRIAWNPNQVLNWEQFRLAGIHKVAANIMLAFGDDYKDNRADAMAEYRAAMNLKVFEVDTNMDGRRDETEKYPYRGITRT